LLALPLEFSQKEWDEGNEKNPGIDFRGTVKLVERSSV